MHKETEIKRLGYFKTIKSGMNYKNITYHSLHKVLEEKIFDSEVPFLGFLHAGSWVKENYKQDINY